MNAPPAPPETTPALLGWNAARHGADVAFREKRLGIWHEHRWGDYETAVREIALGLHALGTGKGDVVGIVGDNRPEWVFAELAAHAGGAMSLGLYRDALEAEIGRLVAHAGCVVIFAEGEEQVDKLLALGDGIPTVRRIVYWDERGMRKLADPRLLALPVLRERGRALHADRPDLYDMLVAAVAPDDPAILCTTSGTTADPQLAMLPHGRFLRHMRAALAADPKGPDDDHVSVLPMPWIMEQTYCIGWSLTARMKVNFPEDPETAMQDLREIAPTFLLHAPRTWETIAADVRARMLEASPLKRLLYGAGMKAGLAALDAGRRSTFAELVLFRALRDRLGLGHVRSAATGGAALGPETFRFFRAMGIPLRQIYGQTETAGAYTIHAADDVDMGTVGVPFDGAEVRIDAPDARGAGEILVRHPNMMTGYFRNEGATRRAFDDGWLRTGDAGYIDPAGHLVVIDRVADLAETADGTRYSPQFVENKLKFSTYVAEAVVLGHGYPHLSALICIRFPILSRWAERHGIAFTTFADLVGREEVRALMRAEVEAANAGLPEAQRVRKFLLLPKELDADDGELTRTRKVRRRVVAARYADIVAAIYDGRTTVVTETTVSFQDGTQRRVPATVRMVDLHGAADKQEL